MEATSLPTEPQPLPKVYTTSHPIWPEKIAGLMSTTLTWRRRRECWSRLDGSNRLKKLSMKRWTTVAAAARAATNWRVIRLEKRRKNTVNLNGILDSFVLVHPNGLPMILVPSFLSNVPFVVSFLFTLFFCTVVSKYVIYRTFPMTGFELWTFIIGGHCSANWVTTTAQAATFIPYNDGRHHSIYSAISLGAWIAEWSLHSTFEHCMLCPGPWVWALVMTNSFSDPSTTSTLYSFGLFDLILLFVCQICHVNCETENWK